MNPSDLEFIPAGNPYSTYTTWPKITMEELAKQLKLNPKKRKILKKKPQTVYRQILVLETRLDLFKRKVDGFLDAGWCVIPDSLKLMPASGGDTSMYAVFLEKQVPAPAAPEDTVLPGEEC
jgi:hypothetical protein